VEEREIDLLDLLLNILLHWRGLIAMMLVGGILLGAYGYIKSDKEARALQAQYDEQKELLEKAEAEANTENAEDEENVSKLSQRLLEEKMTATQISNVLSVISNEELMADKLDYLENSILMQLDADNVPEEQIVFAVTSDDEENAKLIALAYEDILTGNGLCEYLADQFNISQSAVDELYYVRYSTNRFSSGTNSFSISVIYPDKNICQKMAQAVIDYANEQTEVLMRHLGTHELVVLGQYYSETTRTDLINTKKTYMSDIINLDTSIAKAKDAFTDAEVAYYNCLSNSKMDPNKDDEDEEDNAQEDVDSAVDLPEVVPAHISVKYILLGAVLFAFLYACIIAAAYIFDNRLKLCDNMQALYKIPQLGRIEQQSENKVRPLQAVDNWLIALWNRNKRMFSVDEAVNLAAVAVKIAAGKNELDSVSLIGCNMKNGSMMICEQIKNYLQKEGVTVNILDNVLYDAGAMEELDNAPAAVLVENVASTLYSEIEEELALLKRQNIKTLGGIIVSIK